MAVLQSLIVFGFIVTSAAGTDNGAAQRSLNGRALFDMGVKFKKPILRMMGKALLEHECREHTCSQWTEWSACDVYVGQYGMKTRRRECRVGSNCGSGSSPRNMTDSAVCYNFCPAGYEMSPDGFCLKFYNKTGKTKAVAEQTCRTDGGYLVNINSDLKWKAFEALLKQYAYTSYVYIDGERKDVSSPWTFSYETDAKPYINWASGEPHNGSTEKCLFGRNGYGIYDATCTSAFYFVCEIIPAL